VYVVGVAGESTCNSKCNNPNAGPLWPLLLVEDIPHIHIPLYELRRLFPFHGKQVVLSGSRLQLSMTPYKYYMTSWYVIISPDAYHCFANT